MKRNRTTREMAIRVIRHHYYSPNAALAELNAAIGRSKSRRATDCLAALVYEIRDIAAGDMFVAYKLDHGAAPRDPSIVELTEEDVMA